LAPEDRTREKFASMGNHVFICYADADSEFVLKLAKNLKAREVPVWLDKLNISLKEDWDQAIDKALDDCANFLIVLSETAVNSEEVRGELGVALNAVKPILSVLYRPCRIPRRLLNRQYVDFTSGNPDDAIALEQVVSVLKAEDNSPQGPEDLTEQASQSVVKGTVPRSPLRAGKAEEEKVRWSAPKAEKPVPQPLKPPKKPLGLRALALIFILGSLFVMARVLLNNKKETPVRSDAPMRPEPQEKPASLPTDTAPTNKNKEEVGKSEMVPIPAGEFWMGCNKEVDKECDNDEKPGRTEYVKAFQIDRTEVTVAEYRRCVQAGACNGNGLSAPFWDGKEQSDWAWACNGDKGGRDSHPINCVDWDQARTYCQWVGKRLPTEAEWEKAARGTDGRKYPWGNKSFAEVGKVANIADETAKKQNPSWQVVEGYNDGYYSTAPVGRFPAEASPYGALDMIGNVWEWTADWYDTERKYRSVRGGSWNDNPRLARVSSRLRGGPGRRDDYVGFRCAQ
jgi:formylglycine-generating enzyme required for sulfatase activity